MKTIQEIYAIFQNNTTIMCGVELIDLIDESVPYTNASVVLKFNDKFNTMILQSIFEIVNTEKLSFMRVDNIMYIYYKIEK